MIDNHTEESFCDADGWFECERDYKSESCPYKQTMNFRQELNLGHWINPYWSREGRILFSTWNLNHQIEKSQTVMPGLVKLI
ncbi:DNA fragmentation factor subunit beta-like isoform X2 [Watersipora subatra]|uniref:DNA fragmentation factor subunit beta-like isoform X2 n=1 Tax=Watersipora subatra TaxID=2589382 RepID=UPI00355C421A